MSVALYTILIVIAIIILLALIAPKSYNVNRRITINRPVSEVYNYLKFIKNQNEWSPWKKKDPNMTQTYEGTDGEIGFISKWEGNKEVGCGEQELVNLIEDKFIQTQLRFLKPWKSKSDAYLQVDEEDASNTTVTWGFSGENKFPFTIFFLFFNMDRSVGADFEEGLSQLKKILES